MIKKTHRIQKEIKKISTLSKNLLYINCTVCKETSDLSAGLCYANICRFNVQSYHCFPLM